MQNVPQESSTDNPKIEKVTVPHEVGNSSSTPHSTSQSSPAKSETETYSEQRIYMSETSESEEDSVSEEFEDDPQVEATKFLLNPDEDRTVDPETQARLEQLLQAAGIGQLAAKDGKHLGDPEVLRRLTSSVSCALDEAAAALTRMRSDNPTRATAPPSAAAVATPSSSSSSTPPQQSQQQQQPEKTSLVEACTDGDVGTVRKLLTEGRSVHETSEEGESLLSLACSAGYFELAQVLLAMHANVEDRGIKGECTPLMEAASAGHLDIVRLLVAHGADVNAQSTSGNTPLMYGCAGGHTDVVKFLLENGANVEDHNENGHTPLMEAASAGHVGLAKILLTHGAGINTHSNEFKESALTLACYKGHLDMVRFLLEAGADQEHKTDEMHTALMEASMDGHVEVARLLLDSGAQVNMPTDSFESPLTLAACGGHVDLAMLLIERGANIEEVNDEGYTPLMEAAREGHEEMVHLLLGQGEWGKKIKIAFELTNSGKKKFEGANINAQTDETQETALTLACCGGFTEVADILLKGGADIELGASTPLMEAAQEGHLDLVRFLLENGANVQAQTQTGDTALTYASENGHTDVADLLLQYGADLEHESEGGRTPLMKACRAGHMCTVQFLISKGADVRRPTTNNDHTPLSLACAGGHLPVVELLLSHNADPGHKLKDNSTMLIEAAKGGHTNVVQLLLDYPHSMQQTGATNLAMLPGQVGSRDSPQGFFQPTTVLQEVPDAVRIVQQDDGANTPAGDVDQQQQQLPADPQKGGRKCVLPKSRSAGAVFDGNLTSAEAQQVRTQPLDLEDEVFSANAAMDFLNNKDESSSTLIGYIKNRKKQQFSGVATEDQSTTKLQILEELHRVEHELHGTPQQTDMFQYPMSPQEQCPTVPTTPTTNNPLPHMLSIDIAMQQQKQPGLGTGAPSAFQNLQVHNAFYAGADVAASPQQTPYYFTPMPTSVAVSLAAAPAGTASAAAQSQPVKFQSVTSLADVSQNTAISDRPKAKPVSKKEGKNQRKQQLQQQQQSMLQQQQQPVAQAFQSNLFGQQPQQIFGQLHQQQQDGKVVKGADEASNAPSGGEATGDCKESLKILRNENLTTSILQQFRPSQPLKTSQVVLPQQQKTQLEVFDEAAKLTEKDLSTVEDVVQTIESFTETSEQSVSQQNLQVQPYPTALDESMIASLAAQQDLHSPATAAELSRVEYFAVPSSTGGGGGGGQVPVHALYPYDYLGAAGLPKEQLFQAGFQAGYTLMQQQLACPNTGGNEANVVPANVGTVPGTSAQQYMSAQQQQQQGVVCPSTPNSGTCSHVGQGVAIPQQQQQQQQPHHCQIPCAQHQHMAQQQQPIQQVQAVATQTAQQQTEPPKKGSANNASKSSAPTTTAAVAAPDGGIKFKKGRVLRHQNQTATAFAPSAAAQNYQIDHNSAITQYSTSQQQQQQQQCVNAVVTSCMDVDSETESNHDTALTLACAGGHEELVELLISRGADIEHRDKKGFTPLILAATAGHEKVVEILLNHNADIEAQSERTKDTPLSLACSGGRYEVVELLLNRNANKEHRNVSDYTPLSLAASGGYVNIIKLLLSHGAEINSRTGSKLGISPLMLAAMNGHTAAVKLLLDMGSDINAQIETNRNTALTLACFQGRHEVVSLLLDRKANVEHRAKTGLTPLMEAASGGYVDVGRVLLDKGADVNATPVPSSRDTALTIAADKGHVRFVELLLCRGAQVEVKNKKGNSPLWLSANGGHLPVVELLFNVNADIDSQDNRKVSCLMAAFRKGHVKVVKWMVHHVTQFPSDQEMMRYIATVGDKELLEKCHECVKIIRAAKETQAAKANKNASILLEELETEKTREESKRLAMARKRERKKKKKLEKKEVRRKLLEENKKNNNENYDEEEKTTTSDKQQQQSEEEDEDEDEEEEEEAEEEKQDEAASRPQPQQNNPNPNDKEEGDSGMDANSQGSCSGADLKSKEKRGGKKKKKKGGGANKSNNGGGDSAHGRPKEEKNGGGGAAVAAASSEVGKGAKGGGAVRKGTTFTQTKSPAERDDFEATGNEAYVSTGGGGKKSSSPNKSFEDAASSSSAAKGSSTSPKQSNKREDGWKEVVRKSSVQAVAASSSSESGVRKVSVPLNAISRVIGRGGSNINAIRGATGAHIEVEKQCKGQGERIITIKGSSEVTKHAHTLIGALISNPDMDVLTMVPKASKPMTNPTTLWDKTQIGTKKNAVRIMGAPPTTSTSHPKATATSTTAAKSRAPAAATPSNTRATAPRLAAQAEKHVAPASQAHGQASRQPGPYAVAAAPAGRAATQTKATANTPSSLVKTPHQTFAAKLTETVSSGQQYAQTASAVPTSVGGGVGTSANHPQNIGGKPATVTSSTLAPPPPSSVGPASPTVVRPTATAAANNPALSSPNRNVRPAPTASAPPNMQHYQSPGKASTMFSSSALAAPGVVVPTTSEPPAAVTLRSSTPNLLQSVCRTSDLSGVLHEENATSASITSEYSLFSGSHWRTGTGDFRESQKPVNFAAATAVLQTGASSQHKFIDEASPPPVDASKAPGYRGGGGGGGGGAVCSPVSSSKTSSNSTTPPNMVVASAFQNYQEQQQQKNQNQLPPIGSNVGGHGRHALASNNPDYFADLFKTSAGSMPGMLNMSGEATHSLLPTYSMTSLGFTPPPPQPPPQQQQQSSQQQSAAAMSRLNPKAPEYSSYMHGKPTSHMYDGYQMAGQSNLYMSKQQQLQASGLEGFHRSGMNTQQQQQPPPSRQWMQQIQPPFSAAQSDQLISGIAGMTLQNLAKYTGGGAESLESGGGDLAMPQVVVPPSHGFHLDAGFGGVVDQQQQQQDVRKPPQPIGTGRKAAFNAMDSWRIMGGGDKGPEKWSLGGDFATRNPPSMYGGDDLASIDYSRPMHNLDAPHSFMNAPPFYNQPPLNQVRHDFLPDMPKLDLSSWDNASRSIPDLQDNKQQQQQQQQQQHGWNSKWNQ